VRHAYPTREVLLDVWVVRCYSGEPQGLDGQALRWCNQEELTRAELLPADGPIVAALRLPERLTQISTIYYAVDQPGSRALPSDPMGSARHGKLQGVSCSNVMEALAAASAGADFLVMRRELLNEHLASLCQSVPIPVYAQKIALEAAWALGASGINELSS
jgi:hypothetical protein